MPGGRSLAAAVLLLSLLALLAQPTLTASPASQARLERVEVDPLRVPAPGSSVAVRAVVDPPAGAERVRLHVLVEHEDGRTERTPDWQAAREGPTMLATYWDPQRPGPFTVRGHVHVDDGQVPLPTREGVVYEQGSVNVPEDPTGTAPGTVMWTVAFAGWALAAKGATRRGA